MPKEQDNDKGVGYFGALGKSRAERLSFEKEIEYEAMLVQVEAGLAVQQAKLQQDVVTSYGHMQAAGISAYANIMLALVQEAQVNVQARGLAVQAHNGYMLKRANYQQSMAQMKPDSNVLAAAQQAMSGVGTLGEAESSRKYQSQSTLKRATVDELYGADVANKWKVFLSDVAPTLDQVGGGGGPTHYNSMEQIEAMFENYLFSEMANSQARRLQDSQHPITEEQMLTEEELRQGAKSLADRTARASLTMSAPNGARAARDSVYADANKWVEEQEEWIEEISKAGISPALKKELMDAVDNYQSLLEGGPGEYAKRVGDVPVSQTLASALQSIDDAKELLKGRPDPLMVAAGRVMSKPGFDKWAVSMGFDNMYRAALYASKLDRDEFHSALKIASEPDLDVEAYIKDMQEAQDQKRHAQAGFETDFGETARALGYSKRAQRLGQPTFKERVRGGIRGLAERLAQAEGLDPYDESRETRFEKRRREKAEREAAAVAARTGEALDEAAEGEDFDVRPEAEPQPTTTPPGVPPEEEIKGTGEMVVGEAEEQLPYRKGTGEVEAPSTHPPKDWVPEGGDIVPVEGYPAGGGPLSGPFTKRRQGETTTPYSPPKDYVPEGGPIVTPEGYARPGKRAEARERAEALLPEGYETPADPPSGPFSRRRRAEEEGQFLVTPEEYQTPVGPAAGPYSDKRRVAEQMAGLVRGSTPREAVKRILGDVRKTKLGPIDPNLTERDPEYWKQMAARLIDPANVQVAQEQADLMTARRELESRPTAQGQIALKESMLREGSVPVTTERTKQLQGATKEYADFLAREPERRVTPPSADEEAFFRSQQQG